MHAFTIDKFNTSDLQCTYIALGYVFKSIVDATFTLPEIFPVHWYPCLLKFSRLNSALVSVSLIKLAIFMLALSNKIFTFYEINNLFSDTLTIKIYNC